MTIDNEVRSMLGAMGRGPNRDFYQEYHHEFAASGEAKARAILSDFQENYSALVDVSRCAYLSIGGSTGAEIAYVLHNTTMNRGVLLEFDPEVTDLARKEAARLDRDAKDLQVVQGDASQQIVYCKELLLRWRSQGHIDGVIASAQAVLHELPSRSPNFDLSHFIGEIAWDWKPFLFYIREPVSPTEWPEQVQVSIKDLSSCTLEALANQVKRYCGLRGAVLRSGTEYVTMKKDLAVETITKLFYRNDYRYEMEEQVTQLQGEEIRRVVESHLGAGSTRMIRLSSQSFRRLYREMGVSARSLDGQQLTMPNAFAFIIGERLVASEKTDEPDGQGSVIAKLRSSDDGVPTTPKHTPAVRQSIEVNCDTHNKSNEHTEPIDRLSLLEILDRLTPADLDRLIVAIGHQAAASVSDRGPHRQRVNELVSWLESSTGPGLPFLATTIRSVLPNFP